MGCFSADHARAWRENSQRSMVVWQAGGANSGEVSQVALPTFALYLFLCLSQLLDRRCVYATAAHGVSRACIRERMAAFLFTTMTGRPMPTRRVAAQSQS